MQTKQNAGSAGSGISENPAETTVSTALAEAPDSATAATVMADLVRAALGTVGQLPQEEETGVDSPAEGAAESGTGEDPGAEGEAQSAEPDATEGGEGSPPEEPGEEQLPKGVKRRIDKLTAQKTELRQRAETAESRIAQLEQEMETLKTGQPAAAAPESPNGLNNITDAAALAKYEESARQLIRNIDRYQRNAMRPEDRKRFEGYLAEQGLFDSSAGEPDGPGLSDLRYAAEDTLQQHIPARRQFLQEQAAWDPRITENFPFLKDRSSPDYQQFQQVARMIPEVKRFPHWKLIVGTYLLGLKQLEAKLANKPNGKPAARPPVPPRVPSSASAQPETRAGAGAQTEALRKKALETGSRDDMEAWVKTQLRM